MKVRFELVDVTCIAPMKKDDRDALKLFFAVANDAGDIDKLTSDSEPSIGDPLNVGPYELKKNETLKLFDKPPVERASWSTNPIDFGDQSRLRLALTGFGLHKAELGGGANPDTIFAKVLRAFITSFISLIPKVGDGINKIFEIGIAAAEAEPGKNCLGPLFVFNLEYLGSDLILKLLKSGRSIDIGVTPEQSLPVNVSDKCRRPQYRARLRASLVDNMFDFSQTFESSQSVVYKNKSPEVFVESRYEACRQPSPIKAWIMFQETTYKVSPVKKFAFLRYKWKIDGIELRDGNGSLSISALVTRNNPSDPLGDYLTANENIAILYSLDQNGNLEIHCPETSGMFDLPLSCYLHNEYDEVGLFHRKIPIDSEYIAGNGGYDAYANCMHMRALKHIRELLAIKAILWEIPTDPQPVEAIRMMDDLVTIGASAKAFNSRVGKIMNRLKFRKPQI